MLFDLDLANAIFLFCLVLGGGLLLVTVLLDDIVGGVLDAIHFGFDIGGVTLMPPLLGFVAMFGVGGLIGTQVLQLDNGRASLLGAVAGAAGFALVFGMFSVLRRSETAPAFSLSELVGQTGRVNVAIPARRFGSVFVSYAGASHNLTATADADGASEVVRNATRVVTESATVIKGLTGIDVPTLIGGAMRTGGFTSKASGGDGSEPAKGPPAPPSAQTPRPPAGMSPLNASAEVESIEPIDPVERSAAALAASIRAVPQIERYGHLSLRDIPAGAPRPLKVLWAAAEKELGSRYGHVTVRELLDRFTGSSLH